MTAKEKIMEMLNKELEMLKWAYPSLDHSELQNLITATEQAIFDVPSEEEINKYSNHYTHKISKNAFNDSCAFRAGACYILNYKPETNGK